MHTNETVNRTVQMSLNIERHTKEEKTFKMQYVNITSMAVGELACSTVIKQQNYLKRQRQFFPGLS